MAESASSSKIPDEIEDKVETKNKDKAQAPESTTSFETKKDVSESLKHLGFVQQCATTVETYLTFYYEILKQDSGPVKPGLENVENTVKLVVGPLYYQMKTKSLQLLALSDNRVDYYLFVLPKTLEDKSFKFVGRILKAPDHITNVISEVPNHITNVISDIQKKGVVSTAKNLCDESISMVEAGGKATWKNILTMPPVHGAVNIIRSVCEKGNKILESVKGSGVPLAYYVPLLPLATFDKITNVE